MKKFLIFLCTGILVLGSVGLANALFIDLSLPEYSSPLHDPGTYHDQYLVGDFTFDLTGQTIVSAVISGQWGNSVNPTTAANMLVVDSLQVADTEDYTPDPTSNFFVPWSYTFTDFSLLVDGLASFSTIQTSQYYVRLGATSLHIETAPSAPVPEPSTILLMGAGLLGLVGYNRKRFSKKS